MNSKSLQYDSTDSTIDIPALPQKSFFTAIIAKLSSYIERYNLEQSQAWYRTKREKAEQAVQNQDIVSSLPVEAKLRLGMYHFMD